MKNTKKKLQFSKNKKKYFHYLTQNMYNRYLIKSRSGTFLFFRKSNQKNFYEHFVTF